MADPANGSNGTALDMTHDPEMRALAAELKVLETNVLLARSTFARAAGFTYDNKRDIYGVLGYKDLISTSDYRSKYQRGGIAGSVVDVFPNATWRGGMEIIEAEENEDYTVFEQAWADFDKRLQVQAKFRRVDLLAGLSTYAVLLIGDGNPDLESPLNKGNDQKQILYLQPYQGGGGPATGNIRSDKALADGADATIFDYDIDPKSPRFGLPNSYQLKRVSVSEALQRPVHWSRIIHVAEGLLDDEVFGIPSLERVWNLLDDLDKITGGGAEAFWLRANAGLHLDIDKDMALAAATDTVAALKEQMEAYKHQLTRALRTRGVKVEQLGSDVANFGPNADAVLTQIAGAKRIPKRILTGSEMGELASSQDRDNWADQVNGRQVQYAGPYIVRQLVDRLIQYGYLPSPIKGADAYEVRWPHIQTLTETEKATGAQQWASTNQTQGEVVFTDAEIRDKWYAMAPLTDEQRQEIDDRAAEKMKQQQEAMAAAAPKDKPSPFQKAASANDDEEMIRILAEAIEAGNVDVVAQIVGLGGLETLGDVPGHEFHGNQYTHSGAVSGRKGENFVKKTLEPTSYGSHSKNIKDPEEASLLYEQTHAALENQGYQREKPTTLPFQYQREQSFTHPEGHTARLQKNYYAADPASRARGVKGISRVRLDIKKAVKP